MQGAYGGLIIILAYAHTQPIEEEFWLVTQGGDDILTDTGDQILVQE